MAVPDQLGTYPLPTNVTSSASAVALAPANPARQGIIISNDSTAKLYILLDPTGLTEVTATNFTYVVPAGATFEMNPNPVFSGRIRGIWASTNGSAAITDIS